MKKKLSLAAIAMYLVLSWTLAEAAQNPIGVFPDPAQFGTVAENSSSYPLTFLVSNLVTTTVTITGMNITGPNASNFAFDGSACTGSIPVAQSCQMLMVFTPTAIGGATANLQITVQGLSTPINVPLSGTGGNPYPAITSISPTTAYENSPSATVTINGSGFVSGSTAIFGYYTNGTLSTTYVSPTQLTAQIPASDLTSVQSDYVWVSNPPPSGGSSNEVSFQVIAPNPTIQNSSPASVIAGTTTPIVINGSNFMTGATVLWNGKAIPTTYISSTQLQAQPAAKQVGSPNIIQLAVSNPAPGTTSTPINFDVTYPAKVTVLDLPANSLVWDPYAQRIYASLPSSYGVHGNSIAVINPATGGVGGFYFAGSEPNQLALSNDSSYLYVGLNGNGSVQRLDLPAFTPDINVSLGTGSYQGEPNTAGSLQVYPSDPHSWAAALGSSSCCNDGPLEFFTDSTLLANSVTYPSVNQIVFGNSTTLYGDEGGTIIQVAVNSKGGTLTTQWNSAVEGDSFQYANGLIYGSEGQVFNPASASLVGSYDVAPCCDYSTQVLPDYALNRVFAAGITSFFNYFGVTTYNLSKFTPQAVLNLSQLSGNPSSDILLWGKDGLAFTLESGCCGESSSQLVLVQSPAMFATGQSSPVPAVQSSTPSSIAHGSGNFTVTVAGSGFVAGSQATWNGADLTTSYISASQLLVYVPAKVVASSGTATIIVTNPAPGGGKSGSLTFTIN